MHASVLVVTGRPGFRATLAATLHGPGVGMTQDEVVFAESALAAIEQLDGQIAADRPVRVVFVDVCFAPVPVPPATDIPAASDELGPLHLTAFIDAVDRLGPAAPAVVAVTEDRDLMGSAAARAYFDTVFTPLQVLAHAVHILAVGGSNDVLRGNKLRSLADRLRQEDAALSSRA